VPEKNNFTDVCNHPVNAASSLSEAKFTAFQPTTSQTHLMKTTLLITCAMLGVATLAQAQTAPVRRTFGHGTLPEFLKAFDVDGDGKLSAEEAKAARDAIREKASENRLKWDTDGDGKLSEEEIKAAREAIRAKIEAERLKHFDEADANKDGSLDLAEFSAIPRVARLKTEVIAAMFDRLNGDDDLISKEEFLKSVAPRPPIRPPVRPPVVDPLAPIRR
jgi:Ca2+-binding EF-hand superfamily protein